MKYFLFAIFLLPWGALSFAQQQPVDVRDHRQVFIDGRFLERKSGVEVRVHPPRKTGGKILVSDYPFEMGGYTSVLKDGDTYHLWYVVSGGIAYARSRDGIHWEKPRLHLSHAAGTAENNIVIGSGAGGVTGAAAGCMVFLDPHAAPDQRFRMVANPEEFHHQLQLFSSPDGIHWTHTHRDIMTFRTDHKPHHLDSQNVIFWDARIGKYVAYVRKNMRGPGTQGRTVARGESKDLNFGPVEDLPVVFRFDDLYPGHDDPLHHQHVSVTDVYTNGTFPYPWADDAYYMFPALYYHYGSYLREFSEAAPVNAGVLDVRFAASRDGIHWNTYDTEPFVRLGMKGEFDSRRIYMTYGVVPALDGRYMYMYYMGTNETHGWGRDDRNNKLLTVAGLAPAPEHERAIGRVVLRRDGFLSVHAGRRGGEFTTPPLRFQGNQLVLNVDTSAPGELRVEMQDVTGNPLPGFVLADSDIIHSSNETDRPVSWKGRTDLSGLEGKIVRLHFALQDTDLYAFQFRTRPAF